MGLPLVCMVPTSAARAFSASSAEAKSRSLAIPSDSSRVEPVPEGITLPDPNSTAR